MAIQEVIVEEELSAPQVKVLSSRAQVTLDMAGQGSGKSRNIGNASGMMVTEFPQALGFIGANTNIQLSQSTLIAVFRVWKEVFGYTEYDKVGNPQGAFVVDKKPPPGWPRAVFLRDWRGTISFFNGALIFIGSLENYMAHEGKEFAWAHLDETKDTREDAVKQVILARLRQYGLWFDKEGDLFFDKHITPTEAEMRGWRSFTPLTIHTSPPKGGVVWLNEMFSLGDFKQEIKKKVLAKEKDFFYHRFDNKAIVIYSSYHNQHNLAPEYLKNRELDLVTEDNINRQVHAYPFAKDGGEWYPVWNEEKHVRPYQKVPRRLVMTSWDFNVKPHMTMLAAQGYYATRYISPAKEKYDTQDAAEGLVPIEVFVVHFYRNYCLRHPRNSSECIAEDFREEHEPGQYEVDLYGDASGNNRYEGLGSSTPFSFVEEYMADFMYDGCKKVRPANIGINARRQFVSALLVGKKYPEIEVYFDPSMKDTIDDFANCKEGKDGEKFKTEQPDPITGEKVQMWGHETDCVEYLLCELFRDLVKASGK